MKKIVMKYVLQNIVKFGSPNLKSIAGKVFAEHPEFRNKKDDVFREINNVIKEVLGWSEDKRRKEFESFSFVVKKKQTVGLREFRELPSLKEFDRDYVFRVEISPSGMLHVGHILVILLNSEYAKKYNGKFVLRISDTNPENIDPLAYKDIVDDVKWITQGKLDEVVIQSDKMDIYYMYAKQLIEMEKAYVCTCPVESVRRMLRKKESCPCRRNSVKKNFEEWRKMFTEYQPEEAVLRIRTDLEHKNPAVRDWPAFRINDAKHPKQGKKYRVWPLMNFSVAVDDYEDGLTHVIRGKDHIVNKERQEYIYKYFDWWIPDFIHIGRINFTGMKLKTSVTKEDIKKGKYTGWDDIRLPFVGAFRRRGILSSAFMKYVHEIGPSRVDKTINFDIFMKAIYSYNKEFIDGSSNRYFFLVKPKKLLIKDAPVMNVKAPLHPDFPKKGSRNFKTSKEFYVDDVIVKNKMYRFMHLFNFKNKTFISRDYDSQLKATLIHWLPVSDDLVRVWVVMPDGKTVKGLGEKTLKKVKVHDIVQMERFGFCRLDKKEKDKLVFWYAHR